MHHCLANCELSLFFSLVTFRGAPSRAYHIKIGGEIHLVYCKMENTTCGEGGWALAMKINGSKVRTCFLVQNRVKSFSHVSRSVTGRQGLHKPNIPGYTRLRDLVRDFNSVTKISQNNGAFIVCGYQRFIYPIACSIF